MPTPPRALAGLLIVGFGTLTAPLDTAVNIAFPSMTRDFALELGDIRWVVIAYVLTYASLMLICGRLGDLIGYRPVFRFGLLLSAAGFVVCALAPAYGLLLAGRMLQGLGAALTLSCGPALVTSMRDESERTSALAFYAAVIAVGGALGPLAGGLLVERWGWPAVFWFRLPIAMLALGLSGLLPAARRAGSIMGLDGTGAVLLIFSMCTLLLAFSGPPPQLGATVAPGLLMAGLVSFGAFVVHETRHQNPLIRLSLFLDPSFSFINAVNVIVNLAAFSVLILVPYYLVRIAGLGTASGGLMLALGALGTIAGSWLADRLSARASSGRLALAGTALTILGLWSMALWTHASPLAVIALSLAAQGVGLGLFQVGYSDYVTGTLPVADRGVAGSLTMVTRTIGVVLGASGLSAAFTHFEAAAGASGASPADAFLSGFQSTLHHVSAGLAFAFAVSLLRPRLWRIGG